MATLHQLISSIRLEIADRTGTQWQDDELIRAIDKSVSLMGRLLPKKGIITATITSGMIVDDTYLDITTILPTTARLGDSIQRVEYPTGKTPPEFIAVEVMGNYLWLKTNVPIIAGETVRLLYQGVWTAPTESAAGDYPPHLDNVVIIGAAGQALIFKAESILQQAAAVFETLVAPTAYTFVKPTAPTLPDVPAKPTAPTLSFTDAETAMSAVATEITAAKAKLTSGEVVINAGTRGDNVAENWGSYGKIVMEGAGHRVNEAIARLRQVENILGKYSGEVTAFGSETNAYANNVSALVSLFRSKGETESIGASVYASEVNAYVARINGQKAKADALLDIAGRYLASGQSKINEFLAALGYKVELHKGSSAAEQRS